MRQLTTRAAGPGAVAALLLALASCAPTAPQAAPTTAPPTATVATPALTTAAPVLSPTAASATAPAATATRPPAATPLAPSPTSTAASTPTRSASAAASPTLPAAPRPPTRGPDSPTSSTTPTVGGTNVPAPPPGARREPAPIDAAEVARQESQPPGFVLRVKQGLPSGCARPGGHEVTRQGTQLRVAVWNFMPADPNTACTAIYGTRDLQIPLGSDFTPGTRYVVQVNDRQVAFTA